MIPIERNPFTIRIGGLGGQGNIKMGLILAKALTNDKKWVIQTQHYGAQVRGGVAYSDVLFCDDPIDFPIAYSFNVLYMMDQKPLNSFFHLLKPNGVLICDSTFVKQIHVNIRRVTKKILVYPVTEICIEKFGMPVLANVMGLGILQKATGIVNLDALKQTISEEVPKKFIDINLEALEHGYKLCDKCYTLKEEKKYTPINFE